MEKEGTWESEVMLSTSVTLTSSVSLEVKPLRSESRF